jgi:hypothetical protein
VEADEGTTVAISQLAELEATCEAPTHADLAITLTHDAEGHHFHIQGENAFIYARLFLALEQSSRSLLEIERLGD